MSKIVSGIQSVTDFIGQIIAAIHSQNDEITHINLAIAHMDAATQQNSALVAQTSATAESMNEQKNLMEQAVSAFVLPENFGQITPIEKSVYVADVRRAPITAWNRQIDNASLRRLN